MGASTELVERVEVLILLLLSHVSEEARGAALLDPVDLEDLEARRPHKLVQLGENSAGSGLVKVLSDRPGLDHQSEEVKVITLLNHEFVRSPELLPLDQLVRPQIDLSRPRHRSKLLLQAGDLGLKLLD